MKKIAFILLFVVGCNECTAKEAAQKKIGGTCWGDDKSTLCLVTKDAQTEVWICDIDGIITFEAGRCDRVGSLR